MGEGGCLSSDKGLQLAPGARCRHSRLDSMYCRVRVWGNRVWDSLYCRVKARLGDIVRGTPFGQSHPPGRTDTKPIARRPPLRFLKKIKLAKSGVKKLSFEKALRVFKTRSRSLGAGLRHAPPPAGSRMDALVVSGRVLSGMRTRPPLWLRATTRTLKAPDDRECITVMTDCSGIEAPMEGLRCLEASGWLADTSIRHAAACECDGSAREFALRHHVWPDCMFDDILRREFSASGRAYDLLQQTVGPLPQDVTLYTCGFPCKPFSSRNTSSTVWGHPEAQVAFSMIKTVEHVQPQTLLLENVYGLASRGNALAKILEELRRVGEYRICVVKHLSPVELGLYVQRPRIYVCGVRRDCCKFETEAGFQGHIWAAIQNIKGIVARKVGKQSFLRTIKKHLKETERSGTITRVCKYFRCACSLDRTCDIHSCKCPACRGDKSKSHCAWRRSHRRAWGAVIAPKSGVPLLDYFEYAHDAGLEVDATISHRERDLINLYFNKSAQKRKELDISGGINTIVGHDAVHGGRGPGWVGLCAGGRACSCLAHLASRRTCIESLGVCVAGSRLGSLSRIVSCFGRHIRSWTSASHGAWRRSEMMGRCRR